MDKKTECRNTLRIVCVHNTMNCSWKEICASKAVILGLKRYSFRREYAATKLSQVGFTDIELVDAFDGFYGDVDTALRELGLQFIPTLGPGHKGCCYSHIRAWKQMIDDNVPYRIFFEDDVLPNANMHVIGEEYWKKTPKDFDILFFGNEMNPDDTKVTLSTEHVLVSPCYCLHAYMLSRTGAIKLFNMFQQEKPTRMIDMQIKYWQDKNTIRWYCWNGNIQQKSYPTYSTDLPWQFFLDIITPGRDTGIFFQNMRVGTTLEEKELFIPQLRLKT